MAYASVHFTTNVAKIEAIEPARKRAICKWSASVRIKRSAGDVPEMALVKVTFSSKASSKALMLVIAIVLLLSMFGIVVKNNRRSVVE